MCRHKCVNLLCMCIKWVRGCASIGLAVQAMDRLSLTLFNFCKTKHNKIVGVNRSAIYNVLQQPSSPRGARSPESLIRLLVQSVTVQSRSFREGCPQRYLSIGAPPQFLASYVGHHLASPGATPSQGVGDTLLWGNPSREASPCRPSRAPLRCDPDSNEECVEIPVQRSGTHEYFWSFLGLN